MKARNKYPVRIIRIRKMGRRKLSHSQTRLQDVTMDSDEEWELTCISIMLLEKGSSKDPQGTTSNIKNIVLTQRLIIGLPNSCSTLIQISFFGSI